MSMTTLVLIYGNDSHDDDTDNAVDDNNDVQVLLFMLSPSI